MKTKRIRSAPAGQTTRTQHERVRPRCAPQLHGASGEVAAQVNADDQALTPVAFRFGDGVDDGTLRLVGKDILEVERDVSHARMRKVRELHPRVGVAHVNRRVRELVRQEHRQAPPAAAQLHEHQPRARAVRVGVVGGGGRGEEAPDAASELLQRRPRFDELLLAARVAPPVVEPNVLEQGAAQRGRGEGAKMRICYLALEREVERSLLAV